MRPKLRVECYKESGKAAYNNKDEETDDYPFIDSDLYPTLVDSFGKQPTRSELWEMQEKAVWKLEKLIKSNDDSVKYLSPEKFGFNKEYIYIVELIHDKDSHYKGYLNFMMKR